MHFLSESCKLQLHRANDNYAVTTSYFHKAFVRYSHDQGQYFGKKFFC